MSDNEKPIEKAVELLVYAPIGLAMFAKDTVPTFMPVRSATIVWKSSSASSRPCEISGWYGVYAVYHAGFSRMLRKMTPGVCVP